MSDHTATLFHRLQHTPLRDAIRGRLTARLDLEKLFAESDAPTEAVDCVRRVVRKARLWRAERVEVAEELLAHFIDAHAAGTPPEEVIEQFGDERQAARLIRRAKRRQRPLAWHAWRVMMWSVMALLVCYVGLWVYFWTGTPRPTVDYLAQFNARAVAVPPDQRAWPIYETAAEDLKEFRDETFWGDMPREVRLGQPLPPDHEAWPKMEQWLLEHQGAIAQVREASKRPGLGFVMRTEPGPFDASPVISDSVMFAGLPALGTLRMHARVLQYDALRAAANNDGQTVFDNTRAMLRIARQCDEHPILIEALVGISIQALVLSQSSEMLERDPSILSAEQWRDLAHEISVFDAVRLVQDSLAGERTTTLDIIQRTYTDDGEGDGRITWSGARAILALMSRANNPSGVWSHLHTSCASTDYLGFMEEGLYREYAATIVAPLTLARTVSREQAVRMTNHLYRSHDGQVMHIPAAGLSLDTDRDVDKLMNEPGYWILRALIPAFGAAQRNTIRLQAKQSALLTAIALELYRRDHHTYPTTLDDLAPTYLPAVPPDPMTGEPLKYRNHEGQPIIYSVGSDRDDDFGRAPLGNDDQPEPIRASNFFVEPPSENAMKTCEGDWVLYPVFNIPKIEKQDD